jgi:hypothetical protein
MFIPDLESRIRIFYILDMDPDPRVKKAPDPGSATQCDTMEYD